ncbi:hypothetical protein FRC12_008817 [Ceratobasidium sp. 428]|nr:hypothetical protein FRC12_008817 [Ceratobasidium sp. 428]
MSIDAFEKDLQYHASCLDGYKGQLKLAAVAQYINDLSEDLGEHMERMRDSLDIFIAVGIPAIRASQGNNAISLQSLSTVVRRVPDNSDLRRV